MKERCAPLAIATPASRHRRRDIALRHHRITFFGEHLSGLTRLLLRLFSSESSVGGKFDQAADLAQINLMTFQPNGIHILIVVHNPLDALVHHARVNTCPHKPRLTQ
ncbi:hypothetical protein KEM60_02410 [Austwickia sp. TVS 96-490-7B]|nr:hypothetical protein [Austwickia sp. TVS 96-490-7B]